MRKWPVLKSYEGAFTAKIALPLGGIGTGTVSLGGRGDLRDWECVNRPAKGFTPDCAFFALNVRSADGRLVTRGLEGPIALHQYEGSTGAVAKNHGLPRFRSARFEAAYPFGQVVLTDPDVPIGVRLQAFNPLIPGDSDRSGIPGAILRYVLTNETDTAMTASVCGSLPNFIGQDGTNGASAGNSITLRQEPGLTGVFMQSRGVDPEAEQWGTMALSTTADSGITHRTAWPKLPWGGAMLSFWDDFSSDGQLDRWDGAEEESVPTASLAVTVDLPPHSERQLTFLLTWHFPNRMSWTPVAEAPVTGCAPADTAAASPGRSPDWIGNYYTTRYADAWDAALRTASTLTDLEDETLAFVEAFCDSSLPTVVKEAALFNLSTLRTQTCFRTADGRFFGWEGCDDKKGSCHGSCTHVWNYETATAFLFGDLARSMREVEFAQATGPGGLMSFRVNLPLAHAQDWNLAAADGQMGCLMKLHRDWKLSGDDALLRALWPAARRALEFCWIPGGWDGDRDGVMEGCQHNTMDVEYFGPNPQMGAWYLGALRACEEMAAHLGESEFAAACRTLFDSGSAWIDANLFNGDYYEHQVRPPLTADAIAAGIRHDEGARNLADPELQLGAGCLVDQLAGQYMAHVCGLGYLLNPEYVRATLQSIMRDNFQPSLYGHFNHMRTFALDNEAGLLMASYPRGRRPRFPFPYYNELMTGFEYTAAVGMLYEGLAGEGMQVVQAVRERYDGLKRSPFDEAECGHHYARAMTAWSLVLALTGFHYDAGAGAMEFTASDTPASWFWSTGSAWGTVSQTPADSSIDVELKVFFGAVALQTLTLNGAGSLSFAPGRVWTAGETAVGRVHTAPAR